MNKKKIYKKWYCPILNRPYSLQKEEMKKIVCRKLSCQEYIVEIKRGKKISGCKLLNNNTHN